MTESMLENSFLAQWYACHSLPHDVVHASSEFLFKRKLLNCDLSKYLKQDFDFWPKLCDK